MAHGENGLDIRNLFSRTSRGWELEVRVLAALVSSERSVLGLRTAAFLLPTHVTSSVCEHTRGERASSLVSLLRKALILLNPNCFIKTSSSLNYHPKALFQYTITLGVRLLAYEFWGDTDIQCITCHSHLLRSTWPQK